MTDESALLWSPSPERIAAANITKFIAWLRGNRGLDFTDYRALQAWSCSDLEGFWGALWEYCGIIASKPFDRVLGSRAMPGAEWFPGARLNYAEHLLRHEREGEDALLYVSEGAPLKAMSWPEIGGKVRVLATRLRAFGVKPGDRIAAVLPNAPEAFIALAASAAIGAIWSSCSPDFGPQGVLDRLRQLEPKVLFCVDGYVYGGKSFDRRPEMARIAAGLPSLTHVVELARVFDPAPFSGFPGALSWSAALDGPKIAKADFAFEQLPFAAPLWCLFSSGTTGLPKGIVHSHGGILMQASKAVALEMDLNPGDVAFFYTTTGWMMWNFLTSMALAGVKPVLFDGNPTNPDINALWRVADESGAAFVGSSPSFVELMRKAKIVPKEHFAFKKLRALMPAGSPVSPDCGAWFYDNVKRDLWLATGSGGTDVCGGLVGGAVTQPVYAGEIQTTHLGVAAASFDEDGRSIIDEVGELVVTQPIPSMPVFLWGDADGSRYRETYFDMFPGVWRQGDLFRMNARGGCFVLGRSDSTLNRHGVRIGTAEIYRTLEVVEEIADAMIVNLDLKGGGFFMPLFVKLKPGRTLDDVLRKKINDALRNANSPRHVPDVIEEVPAIPATLTGKRMEVPVRKLLLGVSPEKALNHSAMADPQAIEPFLAYAAKLRAEGVV